MVKQNKRFWFAGVGKGMELTGEVRWLDAEVWLGDGGGRVRLQLILLDVQARLHERSGSS